MKYLDEQLRYGVYPDGVENEMAAGYDMGTASDYFSVLSLVREAASVLPPLPPGMYDHVTRMFDYGFYISDPRGCLPQHGDSNRCDHGWRPDVETFFNRSDWTYVRTNGQNGTKPSGLGHETPSVFFDWAGQASMRSGFEADAEWLWFDVGPYGSSFHAHRDKLGSLCHPQQQCASSFPISFFFLFFFFFFFFF